MRCGFAALFCVGVAGCTCAPSVPSPERVQYIDARVASREQVTILPKEDGSIGGVVVRAEGVEVLLNKPYATATIETSGRVTQSTYDPQLARREFQSVLAVLPARPAQFLLYFLEGTDEMTPESEAEVGKIFAELATRPSPEILVIGHTDAVGSVQFNDKLSLQRAEHVRDELIRRGIPAKDITIEGRGKREPVVSTANGKSEPLNRRVEINVR
jgi:outer membrane protein OmpA-like peptidoglycan-associated protein